MNVTTLAAAGLAGLSFFLAGCMDERSNSNAVPDRGKHAFNMTSEWESDPSIHQAGDPQAGEQVITVAADDRLYKIAQRHNVTVRQIIERNDLTAPPAVGSTIIVPQ
jgi:hypothetical protein